MHSEVIAEIYRGAGELLHVNHPLLNPLLSSYKALLQRAGKEVVETVSLSEETKSALESPFIPHNLYREKTNEGYDGALKGKG